MHSGKRRTLLSAVATATLSTLSSAAGVGYAQTYTEIVLHNFTGPPDGAQPTSVILDRSGNLYGATYLGGYNEGSLCRMGCGTVYEVTAGGEETVLYSFPSIVSGVNPTAPLIRDAAGDLYGTTNFGGSFGVLFGGGTAFRLSASGRYRVLYNFEGPGGGTGVGASGLVPDSAGNFYGTTDAGGAYSNGTVFEITPKGTENVLYSFPSMEFQLYPSGVIRDSAGNLFGVTAGGGTGACQGGCGTVFEVSPDGTEKTLYNFGPSPDGNFPTGALLRDAAGNFYGTTEFGGSGPCFLGCGTVFKLTPSGEESVLYSFTNGSDGGDPNGPLVHDSAGNLYGTAFAGGKPGCGYASVGCGTVFEVTQDGVETVVWTFGGPPADGANPEGGLARDQAGNLYGATYYGGSSTACNDAGVGCGIVFKLARSQ